MRPSCPLPRFVPFFVLALLALLPALPAAEPAATARFELKEGDRIAFLGDRLIEEEQYHGWIEVMLTTRFPDRALTFRNLGWNGDTPAGESRLGLSYLQAGAEPPDEAGKLLAKQIEENKPTVVFVGYGMASSFDGAAGLPKFAADYRRLLEMIAQTAPGVRFVLLSPIPHETLVAPWPNPASHNASLAAYTRAIAQIAAERGVPFVSLFDRLAPSATAPAAAPAVPAGPRVALTDNGIVLNSAGYRRAAEVIEDTLFGSPGAWRTSPQAATLAAAIQRKNEWFFHRSRPANMAYIFGFRRREQGRNAGEVTQFETFIAAEEKRIAQLRSLQPVAVAEVPRHVGNASAAHVPQPHPAFDVAEGFEITLWAENPLLHKPLQMNFDPAGRLWVVSSEVYPQIEPGQVPSDKVIVLEDTTGGGKADRATVFADGLLIPTGVAPGDGGVYVAQSTDLLHFKDTDGDGKADVRRRVLTGFGTEDTHHNLHTLRWGPDSRLYMNQAVYTRTHTETPHGVVRLRAGGTFRFDPRDQRMEVQYRGWVNSWGHQFDAFGQSFATDGAGTQGINWAVPGATYFTLAPARRILQSISPGPYPKFAGIEVIRSSHFPDDWQGDIVTADFRAHRLLRFKLTDQGAGYVTRQMPDVLRSTAASFRPLDAQFGPDGALYIADWSNPIIQHGEVDFRDPRRDKEHGRIWRLAAKGRPLSPKVNLTTQSTGQLLTALLSPNSYDQQQARRVLAERGAAQVMPEVAAWTKKLTTEEQRLQALWLTQSLAQPDPTLLQDLHSAKDPRVRAAAVRATPAVEHTAALTKLVADENPRVRLEAVRALGRVPTVAAAEAALTILDRPMDPFLDYALWLTMNDLAEPMLAAMRDGSWKIDGREKQLEFALKAVEPARAGAVLGQMLMRRPLAADGAAMWIELIGAAGGAGELAQLFTFVQQSNLAETAVVRGLTALREAARLRTEKPTGDLARLNAFISHPAESVRVAALALAGTWKSAPSLDSIVAAAEKPNASANERAAAFAALRDIGGPNATSSLTRLAGENHAFAIRREAALALAGLDLASAMPVVLPVLKAAPAEDDAQLLWRGLLAIRGAGARLATEVPKSNWPPVVAKAGLRPAREGAQNDALVQALLKAGGLTFTNVTLTAAEMQALASEALAKGDAARGELLYRRGELACVACHAIGGAGGKVGPDLTSIGASSPPDYLVESLLYPNAKVKEGYHAVSLATKDRQDLAGSIVRESATEIVLRNAANQEVSVAVNNVARRNNVGSLMPAGLIDQLLPEERLDVIKFLAMLGRPGDYDAARGGVARAFKFYLVTSVIRHLGHEGVIRGDPTLAAWVPLYALTNGTITRPMFEAAFPARSQPSGFYALTQFQSTNGGPVHFVSTGGVKVAWLDGKETRAGDTFTVQAKPGLNTLVVQLPDLPLPDRFSLRSDDVAFVLNP